jgi:hypothetical protein
MEVSGQLHALASVLSQKHPPVPTEQHAGQEKNLVPAGIWTPNHPACSLSTIDRAIMAPVN